MPMGEDTPLKDITYKIIGVAMGVITSLGLDILKRFIKERSS